jgi:molybdopterin/thiamine biosynthesis adenylyltransferase
MTRPSQKYRYQEILWGKEGQARVRAGRVGVFGVGGTGAAHAQLLARAGVGYLRLVDRDVVEAADLHRTQLFDERDAADVVPKAEAAARRIGEINGDVRVEAVVTFVNASNATGLAEGLDVLVDGSDNFRLRFLLNDVAVKAGVPLVYQGAEGGRGAVMAVVPGTGPCLRCVLEPPAALDDAGTCARVGVSPAVVAATASWGASLTLALLRGEREAVAGRLLRLEEPARVASVTVGRVDGCPACGRGEFSFLEGEAAPYVNPCCGGEAFEVFGGGAGLDMEALAEGLPRGRVVKRTDDLIRVDAGAYSAVIFRDGRALIYGARDAEHARAIFGELSEGR